MRGEGLRTLPAWAQAPEPVWWPGPLALLPGSVSSAPCGVGRAALTFAGSACVPKSAPVGSWPIGLWSCTGPPSAQTSPWIGRSALRAVTIASAAVPQNANAAG